MVAGGALVAGGELGAAVTVEVAGGEGDGVEVDPDFRAFATRMATTTITKIAIMTRMMLRNVWSGRGGGPDGEPHPS